MAMSLRRKGGETQPDRILGHCGIDLGLSATGMELSGCVSEGVDKFESTEPTEIPIGRAKCCSLFQGERRQCGVGDERPANLRLNG